MWNPDMTQCPKNTIVQTKNSKGDVYVGKLKKDWLVRVSDESIIYRIECLKGWALYISPDEVMH